jgi:hypothetical protein
VSLPKTFAEVSTAVFAGAIRMKTHELLGINEKQMQDIVHELVMSTLMSAGIKIDEADDKTLIYPSTVGTNTPRYQVEEQRNPRWKGRR